MALPGFNLHPMLALFLRGHWYTSLTFFSSICV